MWNSLSEKISKANTLYFSFQNSLSFFGEQLTLWLTEDLAKTLVLHEIDVTGNGIQQIIMSHISFQVFSLPSIYDIVKPGFNPDRAKLPLDYFIAHDNGDSAKIPSLWTVQQGVWINKSHERWFRNGRGEMRLLTREWSEDWRTPTVNRWVCFTTSSFHR